MANFKVVWFSNHDSYMFSLEKDEFNPERFLRFLVETKLRSARGRNDWNANMEQRNDQYISIQYLDIEDELISLGTLESEFESFKKCVSVMMSRKNMVTLFASFKQKLNSDEKLDLFSKVMEPKQEKGKQSGSKSGSEQGDGSKSDNEQGVGSESGNEQGVKKPSSSLLGEPGMQNSIFITDEELPEYLVECTSPDGTPGLRSLNGDEKTLQRVLFEIMHAIRKHVLGKSFPCGYNKIVFWPDKSHALIGFTDNTFVLFEDKNKETCPETMGRLGEKTRRLNSFLKFIEAGLASYVDLQPAVPTVPWMEDYMKKFKTSLIQEVRGAVKEIVDKSPSNSDNIFDDGVYQVATMEADDDPLHKETEALFMLYTKEMFNKTFNAGICDCIHVNGSLNFVTDRPLQDYVFPDSVYTVHIGVSARGAVIPGLSRPEDEFQLAINTASKFRLYTELVKFDANEDFGFWSAAIKIKVPAIVGTYRIFFQLLLANLSVGVKIPLVLIAPDIAGTPCLVSELNDNPLYKGINKNPYIRPSYANENPLQRALIPEAVVAVRDDGQKDDKDEGYDDTDEINNNNQEKEKDVAVKAKDSAINNPEDEQQHAAVNNNQEDEQHAVVNDQEKEKDSAINDQEKEKDSAINNLEKEKDDSVVSNNNNKMNNEISKDSEYFSDCSSDSSASLLCDAKEILEKIFVDGVDNRLALPACFMPNLSTPKEKDVKPDSAKQAILETFDPLRNNEVKVELPKKTSPVSDIEIERLTDEVFKMHGKFFGEDDSSWVDVENIFGGDIYSSKQEQQQMQQQQVQQQVQQQQVLQQQVEQQQMQQQVLQQQVEQQQMQQHVLQQQVEQQQMQQQVLQQQVEQQQMQQQVEQQQVQQQQQVEQQQMQQQQAQQQVQHGFTCSVATAGATATTVTTMTTAAHPHTANKMDEPPVDEDNSFRGIRKPPVEILPMSVLNAIGHMMSIGDPHKRQQNQQAAHALMEQHRYQKPVSVSQFDQAKALLEQHRYQKPVSVSQFDQAKALIEQHRYQKPVSVSQYDQGKALLEQHRYQKPVSVSQYDQAKALMEQHSRYQKPVSLAEFDRYMHDMHYNKHAEPILKGIYDDYQTKLTTARIAACHLQQPYQQEQQQQQQYQPTIAVTPSFFTNPYPSHQHHHQQQQEQQQEPRHQQVKDNYIRTQSQSAQNPLLSGLLYGGQHQTTATSQMLPSSNPVSSQTTPPYVSQQSKLGYHGFPLQASYASQSTLMQPRTPKSDASQLSRSSMGQTAGLSQYAVSHLSSAGSTQCGGVSQSPTSSGGLSQYAVSETPVTGSSSPQYNMPENPPIQTSTELWDMKIPSQTTSFASQQYEIMSSQQTPGGLTQTVITNATDGRSADGMLNGTADGRSTNVISNGPDYRPVGGLSTGTTDGNRSANVNHHGYDITGGAHILDQQQPPY